MKRSIVFAAIFLTFCVTNTLPRGFADQITDLSGVPRPQTGGAWPTFYYSPSSIWGEYGPAIQLAPVTLDGIPKNILIEKSLATRFEAESTIPVGDIQVTQQGCHISQGRIESLKAAYQNKSIAVADLNKLATALYNESQRHGAVCDISVDPSGLNNLSLNMTPVQVRQVKIEDGKFFSARAVKSRLSLKQGKPLNVNALEREVREIQNNPDIQLETRLEPVEFSHDVDVTLKIKDEKIPLHVAGFFNNIDLKEFGNYFEGATAVYNNITGYGDTLAVGGVFSNGGQGLMTHYELPVGHLGTKLYGEYSFVHASPRGPQYSNLEYTGRASVTTLGVIQPLYDRKSTRIAVDANLDIKQARTQVFRRNIELERIRTLRFGFQLDRDDRFGNTSLRDEIGAGFPFWGGSSSRAPLLAISRAGSQYFRNVISLTRTQNLPLDAQGVFRAFYQTTPNNLPPTDVYAAGGTLAGRGYREGLTPGDKALYASGELHFPCYFIPKNLKIPFSEDKLRDNLDLLTFVDYAWTHLNNQDASVDASEQFLSTGVGVRLKLTQYFSGRLDVGFPLLKQNQYKNRPRIHFGIESAVF